MEEEQPTQRLSTNTTTTSTVSANASATGLALLFADNRNILLAILTVVLIMSMFRINILASLGDLLIVIIGYLTKVFGEIMAAFSYSAGTAINKTSDMATDTSKAGIEIANGAVHNIGNLLRSVDTTKQTPPPTKTESMTMQKTLQEKFESKYDLIFNNDPEPDFSDNSIQTPGSYNDKKWNLATLEDSHQCITGQFFPSQKLCLNPTLTTGL